MLSEASVFSLVDTSSSVLTSRSCKGFIIEKPFGCAVVIAAAVTGLGECWLVMLSSGGGVTWRCELKYVRPVDMIGIGPILPILEWPRLVCCGAWS